MYRRRFQPLRMWVAIISSRDVKVTRRKKTGEQKNQRRTYSKSSTTAPWNGKAWAPMCTKSVASPSSPFWWKIAESSEVFVWEMEAFTWFDGFWENTREIWEIIAKMILCRCRIIQFQNRLVRRQKKVHRCRRQTRHQFGSQRLHRLHSDQARVRRLFHRRVLYEPVLEWPKCQRLRRLHLCRGRLEKSRRTRHQFGPQRLHRLRLHLVGLNCSTGRTGPGVVLTIVKVTKRNNKWLNDWVNRWETCNFVRETVIRLYH